MGDFARVPKRLLTHTRITSRGARLWALLMTHGDGVKRPCYPGTRLLASELRITRQQVMRLLDHLESEGFITVERKGRGKGSRYRLFADPVPLGQRTTASRQMTRSGHVPVTAYKPKPVTSPQTTSVPRDHESGHTDVTKAVKDLRPKSTSKAFAKEDPDERAKKVEERHWSHVAQNRPEPDLCRLCRNGLRRSTGVGA